MQYLWQQGGKDHCVQPKLFVMSKRVRDSDPCMFMYCEAPQLKESA